jgi:hypothetical protein
MPLIDVVFDRTALADDALRRLGHVLPDIVAKAVACPEEPWLGPPAPGDIEIRFRPKGPFDVGGLSCVIEVRTKRFESRLADKHDRAERIRAALVAVEPTIGQVGVWLILHEGAWAQER